MSGKPKRVFQCPVCESRATVRAKTDVEVEVECAGDHPVLDEKTDNGVVVMEEQDEVQ